MFSDAIPHLNYLAIIVSALLYMVVGYLWYHHNFFGKTWLDAMGHHKEESKGMGLTLVWAFMGALLTAFVLALFIYHLNISTLSEGACVGFWAWLGFSMPIYLSNVLWEGKPWKAFFINASCMLVTLVLMGAILGYWH